MKRSLLLPWLLVPLLAGVPEALAGSPGARDSAQARTELLASELLPQVAGLLGFADYGPVRIEAKDKAELRAMVVPTLREFYGAEGLERRSRVAGILGLIPPDYDLGRGMGELLVEVMGGGYDPLRHTYYTLIDKPPSLFDPQVEKMVAAHELTHALEDQVDDIAASLRRGATDWDYGFVYDAVIEGIAYQTMMAVVAGVSLAEAPDATDMLTRTRTAMAASPAFPVFARTPPAIIEMVFGPAIHGLAFCRAYIQAHPQTSPLDLLANLPVSSEQILHVDRYATDDRPATIDLSPLDDAVPAGWRPYLAGSLGEFDLRLCLEAQAATREGAAEAVAGWDGCRFATYETVAGELILVGLSAWDSPTDAGEFTQALAVALAGHEDPRTLAIEQSGSIVPFVIGAVAPATQRALLARLATMAIER